MAATPRCPGGSIARLVQRNRHAGAFVFAVVAAGADVVSGDAFLSLPHDAAMRLNSAIADAIARLLRSRIILRTPLEVLDTRNLTSSG